MHDVVVPDLVVVTTPSQVTERAIEGSPTIIVENPLTVHPDEGPQVEGRALCCAWRVALLDGRSGREVIGVLPSGVRRIPCGAHAKDSRASDSPGLVRA